MIDSTLRRHYQSSLINPLLKLRLTQKLSPLMCTLLALVSGVMTLPLLAMGWGFLAFVALLLSGFFDTLDGSIARHKDLTSDRGAALDICFDRIVEASVIIGLFLVNPAGRGLLCLLMLATTLLCISSFLVVGIFETNRSEKSFHYSVGLMERTEAFLLFALMILIPSLFVPLSALYSLLVLATALIRLTQFATQSTR